MTPALPWKPADELRNQLRNMLSYRALFDAVWPGAFESNVVPQALRQVAEFIENSSDEQILLEGPSVHQMLASLVTKAKTALPPKASETQIIADFHHLTRTGEFSYTHGVQLHWLKKWFEISVLPIPRDFPLHGVVGVGAHSGHFVVEDQHLLKDAFYLRAKVLQLWGGMEECMRRGNKSDELMRNFRCVAADLNMRLSCFARLGVFSFYAFVECFVNSVAEDFLIANTSLDAKTRELLRGTKKGRLLGIEYKIEKFPQIIRADGKTPIHLRDPKQLREPFTTFVGRLKELRGSTAHFAKHKTPIWLRPIEWVDEIKKAHYTCLEVAREFWNSCYPSRGAPEYLHRLDSAVLEDHASNALSAELDARGVLDLCWMK